MFLHKAYYYRRMAYGVGIYAVIITTVVALWVYHRGAGYVLEQIGLKHAVQIYTPEQSGRAKRFLLYPRSPGDMVFVGDSITQNAPFSEYLSYIKNRGIGGDTTAGLLTRLPEAIGDRPARFILNIGTNDFSVDRSVDFVFGNIELIVKKVKEISPSTRVYVVSILPINVKLSSSSLSTRKQIKIFDLNKKLKASAIAGKYRFINLSSGMSDKNRNLKKEFTLDGTHLNAVGYDVYIKNIAAILNSEI